MLREAQAAQRIRDECEADLNKAIPALRKAERALQKLKKEDISEVKSLKFPPEGVKLVSLRCLFAAVCRI